MYESVSLTRGSTFTPEAEQTFVGTIRDGKILVRTLEGTQQLGVTYKEYAELQQAYQKMEEVFNKYEARLIELKEIEEPLVPLTQEELLQQYTRQLAESQALNQNLFNKLEQFITLQSPKPEIEFTRKNGASQELL